MVLCNYSFYNDFTMAKVTSGIGLALSGKVEEMVFVQFNGGTYTRSTPKRTKDSWTPNMLAHQQRFAKVVQFCGQFKSSVIPQIWNDATSSKVSNFGRVGKVGLPKMSGYALFLKTNMPAFAKDGSIPDPKKIKFSTGKLTLPQGIEAHRMTLESNTIQVSWLKDAHLGGKSMRDELMFMSAADGLYSEIAATGILRGNLTGSFELPEMLNTATHIYLFFTSQDRRNYSESICLEI